MNQRAAPVMTEVASTLAPSDLLRFVTVGSVDDGKSTLIGRLLFDSRAIFEDQLDWLGEMSARRGFGSQLDLSLVTDGLRDERIQGITIDVAYRFYATARRRFIIADAPGHVDLTRNMVTAASNADLAVILLDVQQGVQPQTRRHILIASLLRVPHLVVCVNKMDLVAHRRRAFERVAEEVTAFATRLEFHDLVFIPISALNGDNVVEKSEAMPWYDGTTLMYHLDHVHIASDVNMIDARFPIQSVIREGSEGVRGYAGRMEAGVLRPGDEVTILPAPRRTRVRSILSPDGELEMAYPPLPVVVVLEDEVHAARGDLICHRNNAPVIARVVDAKVCWLADQPLTPGTRLLMKHTTRTVESEVEAIHYRIDIDALRRQPTSTLLGNDVGRARLRTVEPVLADPYRRCRPTGSFILIDPATNETVGAGVIDSAEP